MLLQKPTSLTLESIFMRTYAKKPGFDSKSLFLAYKYLQEIGFLSLPA